MRLGIEDAERLAAEAADELLTVLRDLR